MSRAFLVVLGALLLAASVPGPVAAADDPQFEATVPAPELDPGAEQTVTVLLENDDEDVDETATTATSVRVEARSGDTPIEVVSGPRFVGTLADGERAAVEVRVEVPATAQGGTYRLPLDVTHEFDGDERETSTVHATVRIPERAIFAVEGVDADLHVRETGDVTVTVRNVGSEPGNATRLAVASQTPALTMAGADRTVRSLGDVQPGESRRVSVAVTASDRASARAYALELRPTYRNEHGVAVRAPARTIGVAPDSGPRFAVVDASAAVSVGETGPMNVTLVNRGSSAVSDAAVRLGTGSTALGIEGRAATTRFVGEWAPGETRTVPADVSAREAAGAGSYPVDATVSFARAVGGRTQAGPVTANVTVAPEQRFVYADVNATVRGNSGVLTARVTNAGSRPVEDAVVRLNASSPLVTVVEPTTPVGSLAPGESASVTADLRVSPAATAGPRAFIASVRYDRGGSRKYRADPATVEATLDADADLFAVEPVNATFGVDDSGPLRVRVRNTGDVRLTDVRGSLGAAPPYQSDAPTAYAADLAPGESTVLTFELTTPEDGVPTTDALPVNVSADTPRDRRVVSGPYRVPIRITRPGSPLGSTPLVAVGGLFAVGLLAVGWWTLTRAQ